MRVPGFKSVIQFGRWARSRFLRGALILGYHRIASVAQDPYSICVSPERFAEQLSVLKRFARTCHLTQLIRELKDGEVQPRTVVLTLDDGYADALMNVNPLLEQHQIPATVFTTTGNPGEMFWWDELQQLIYSAETLPYRILSSVDIDLQELPDTTPDSSTLNSVHRRRVLMKMYRRLLRLSSQEREGIMLELKEEMGGTGEAPPLCRALSGSELIKLASSDWIEIGSHSVSHPRLADLPPTLQRTEIEQSKMYLESLINRPVHLFSYPNGSWSSTTERFVRATGYWGACGSHNDVSRPDSNLFCLPRFWVKNQDGPSFFRWLKWWLTG